jgi:hypothetical protein
MVVLVILGVFVLSGAGLALVGTAVSIVADVLDAPADPLPTTAKVVLVAILAGVGAIVARAIAAKNGLVFDTALATQFLVILGAAVVAFLGVTKPLGLSKVARAVSIPLLTPAVSKVAIVVANPVAAIASLPLPGRGASKKELRQQVADLSAAQAAASPPTQ